MEPAVSATRLDPEALVFGTDPTPGIVSVDVRAEGTVTIWRRVAGHVRRETDSHEPWFLVRSLDVLAPLGERLVPLERGQPVPGDALAGYEMLEGDNHYRLLVRVRRLADVDEALMRGYRDRHGGLQVEALREMRGEIYIRAQVEQYLNMRGRHYFKGH